MIRFAEEKDATDPCQSGPLVRDRDLLGQLMLTLELVRPYQVEFGAVGIREEFVVQRRNAVRLTSVVAGVRAIVRRAFAP